MFWLADLHSPFLKKKKQLRIRSLAILSKIKKKSCWKYGKHCIRVIMNLTQLYLDLKRENVIGKIKILTFILFYAGIIEIEMKELGLQSVKRKLVWKWNQRKVSSDFVTRMRVDLKFCWRKQEQENFKHSNVISRLIIIFYLLLREFLRLE